MFVFSFIADHAVELLALAGVACTLGAGIARFTPTDKDDAFFAKVGGWLTKFGTFGLAKSKTKLDA